MQTVTQAYQDLLASLHRKEIQVGVQCSRLPEVYLLDSDGNYILDSSGNTIGDNASVDGYFFYGEDRLVSVKIDGGLFHAETLTFGGCVSRQIELSFYLTNAEIPRMGRINPRVRLMNGETSSEWLSKGIYFIDTRDYNDVTGVMTLVGYDAMLKAEETYIQSGDVGTWPRTMASVAADIAERMDVELDSRSRLEDYAVQLPTGYTMREVLGYIAAAHAGNWIITDEGKLRLIRIDDTVDAVSVGNNASRVTKDDPFAEITHVILDLDEEVFVEVGDDTGRTLELTCPWATENMASAILAALSGYHYQPYEAEKALVEPAAEIGDEITVGGITGILAKQSVNLNSLFASDIAAPAENEIDHEYPYKSPQQREITRKLKNMETSFTVETGRISGQITAIDGRVSTVEQSVGSITQRVEGVEEVAVASVVVQYALSTSQTTAPSSGWSATAPAWESGKYMWQRTVTTYADSTQEHPHQTVSDATCIQGAKGEDGTSGSPGANGYNTAIVYLYKRAASAPSIGWTNTLTYNFASKSLTSVPSGWSQTFPSGSDPLYVTVATAYSQGTQDTIAYTEWTTPTLLVENGEDGATGPQGPQGETGATGPSGLNSATVFLYQRASSAPNAPSIPVLYNFSTGIASTVSPWSKTIPAVDGNPCYVIQATASSTSSADTILSSEWSSPAILVEDGEDGSPGIGINSVTVTYGRSASASTQPSSWQSTIPTVPEGEYLWTRTVTDYTDSSLADTVTYTYSRQGEDGAQGEQGVAGTSVSVSSIKYQAGTSPTTAPTGTWQNNPVAVTAGQYLWTRTTFSDDSIAYGVARQGVDGTNGDAGVGIQSVTVSYGVSSSSSTQPSSWQNTIPSVPGGQYLWTRTTIDYTDSSVPDTTTYTYAKQGEDGENGQAGTSVTVSSIKYQAGTSATTAPTGTWSNSVVSVNPGQYLWTKTTFSDGSVAYGVARQGENGGQGATGYSTAIVYLYKRAASAPSIGWTSTLTYNFTNKALTSTPSGWYQKIADIPASSNPLYVTAATAYSNTGTDTIDYTEWSTPVILAENGEQGPKGDTGDTGPQGATGDTGPSGLNSAAVFLFMRSDDLPEKPSASLTYTFASGSLSGNLGGWSQTIPEDAQETDAMLDSSGNAVLDSDGHEINGVYVALPCYVIQATAASTGTSDSIAASEWSDPVIFVESGSNGGDGVSVSRVVPEYYLSSSNQSPTGGTWTTTCPAWVSGKYIWTRSHVYFDDGTENTTDPVLDNAINGLGRGYTEISQSVTAMQADIALTAAYGSGTIGSNVRALLQLVANADSSSINIKADKINFNGFTTFVRPSDLASGGSTAIDGGRITTGTISADRIDAANLHVLKIYYNSTNDYIMMEGMTSGTWLGYVRIGILNSAISTRGILMNGHMFIFAEDTSSSDSFRIDARNKKIFPQTVGQWDIGDNTTYFNNIYANALYGKGSNSLVDVYKVQADEFNSLGSPSSNRYGKYAFNSGAYLTVNSTGRRLIFVDGNGNEYDVTME